MPDTDADVAVSSGGFLPRNAPTRTGYSLPIRHASLNRREFMAALGLSASILMAHSHRATAAAAVKWDDIPNSPLVHPDGKITFTFPAGDFRSVMLHFSSTKPIALRRDSTGVWKVTIGPFTPQIYSYDFSVDGVGVLDPLNPWVKKNLFFPSNLVLVPGRPPEPW